MGGVCCGMHCGSTETPRSAWLWYKCVDTAKGIQLETVIGTLLVGSKVVDVLLNV